MRRRNRKKRNDSGFILPRPVAGLVLLLATVALAWLWLGCRCDVLGREIQALERENLELAKRLVNEENKWSALKALPNLERALTAHGISMSWPTSRQVVRLSAEDLRTDALETAAGGGAHLAWVSREGRHE